MKKSWRFFLGAGIGIGLGYAIMLLLQAPEKSRLRTIYKAPADAGEERTAA